MTRTINACLFDIGNVLVYWDRRNFYQSVFHDAAELDYFLAEVCSEDWNLAMDAGKSLAQSQKELCARFPQYAEQIRLWDWHNGWLQMFAGEIPESVAMLHQLKQRDDIRLFALTNWSAESFPIAKQKLFPFLDEFERIIVSGEEKLVKPDPALFQIAIDRCQLVPQQTVFIDDNQANIAAAAQMGFQTVHFTSPTVLQQFLQQQELL